MPDTPSSSAAQQEQIDRLLTHLRLGCECPYAEEVADLIATLAPRGGSVTDTAARERELLAAARDLVEHAGEHDGACTNADDPWEACELHVAAGAARQSRLEKAVQAYDE